jgi:hypothetical protein
MGALLANLLSLCLALAATETLHGIARAAWLVPRIGKKKALKVGIVTGSLLALAVCYLLVPRMGITDTMPLLGVGLVAALFMSLFDMALAALVLKRPLVRLFDDFNPATGNYLLFGVVALVFFPLLVMRV